MVWYISNYLFLYSFFRHLSKSLKQKLISKDSRPDLEEEEVIYHYTIHITNYHYKEGKTDYYARKRLIIQDKNKYNTQKYRLVARITCSKVIAQVIYATIQGDKILASADSTELRRFGLEAGLSNYSAGIY